MSIYEKIKMINESVNDDSPVIVVDDTGEGERFKSRTQAIKFYTMGTYASEGSERDRYINILYELKLSDKDVVCADEDDLDYWKSKGSPVVDYDNRQGTFDESEDTDVPMVIDNDVDDTDDVDDSKTEETADDVIKRAVEEEKSAINTYDEILGLLDESTKKLVDMINEIRKDEEDHLALLQHYVDTNEVWTDEDLKASRETENTDAEDEDKGEDDSVKD